MNSQDWFGLPEFTVSKIEEQEHIAHINVHASQPLTICPQCGFSKLHAHSKRTMTIPDVPHHHKPTMLHVLVKRFQCQNCNVNSWQTFRCLNARHHMTERLVSLIQKECLSVSFTSLASTIGVTEGTIRNLFKHYVNHLEATHRFETPRWLGIDEVHINEHMRAVFTNIEERTLFNMLPKRNKSDVIAFLRNVSDIHRVEVVTMDMWQPYRDAVRDVIPNATIIVDQFHVVKTANESLERLRKVLRQGLTPRERVRWMHQRHVLLKRRQNLNPTEQAMLLEWRTKFPLIGQAHDLKESIFDLYECTTRAEAELMYRQIQANIPSELQPHFAPVTTCFRNWWGDIFSYFDNDHKLTNAFTEGMNSMIKAMQHIGRGYTFDVLRARMLYKNIEHAHRKKPKSVSLAKFARNKQRSLLAKRALFQDDLETMSLFLTSTFYSLEPEVEVTQWSDYGTRLDEIPSLLPMQTNE